MEQLLKNYATSIIPTSNKYGVPNFSPNFDVTTGVTSCIYAWIYILISEKYNEIKVRR